MKRLLPFAPGLMVSLLLCHIGRSQTGTGPTLYLVASTPNDSAVGFPTRLYTAASGNVALVREVLPAGASSGSVIEARNNFFFVPFASGAGSIVILSKVAPEKQLALPLKEPVGTVSSFLSVVTEDPDSVASLLFQIAPSPSSGGAPGANLFSVVVGRESIAPITWNAYTRPFVTAGPAGGLRPLPMLARNTQSFSLEYALEPVASLAPPAPQIVSNPANHEFVFSSNERYILAEPVYTGNDASAIQAAKSKRVAIFDRAEKKWDTVTIDGNASAGRLMGDWTCWAIGQSAVKTVNPTHNEERSVETDELPNVASAYSGPSDPFYVYYPGRLFAYNPHTKKSFEIQTGHEDSEIIYIGDHLVIYRSYDTLYQASLNDAGKFGSTTKIGSGEDVPEIHWAFYSH